MSYYWLEELIYYYPMLMYNFTQITACFGRTWHIGAGKEPGMLSEKEINLVFGKDLIEPETKKTQLSGIADGEGHGSHDGQAHGPFTAEIPLSSSKIVPAHMTWNCL
jgi:hypothetical protein